MIRANNIKGDGFAAALDSTRASGLDYSDAPSVSAGGPPASFVELKGRYGSTLKDSSTGWLLSQATPVVETTTTGTVDISSMKSGVIHDLDVSGGDIEITFDAAQVGIWYFQIKGSTAANKVTLNVDSSGASLVEPLPVDLDLGAGPEFNGNGFIVVGDGTKFRYFGPSPRKSVSMDFAFPGNGVDWAYGPVGEAVLPAANTGKVMYVHLGEPVGRVIGEVIVAGACTVAGTTTAAFELVSLDAAGTETLLETLQSGAMANGPFAINKTLSSLLTVTEGRRYAVKITGTTDAADDIHVGYVQTVGFDAGA